MFDQGFESPPSAEPEQRPTRPTRKPNDPLPESRVVVEVGLTSHHYPISRVRWRPAAAAIEG